MVNQLVTIWLRSVNFIWSQPLLPNAFLSSAVAKMYYMHSLSIICLSETWVFLRLKSMYPTGLLTLCLRPNLALVIW